MHPFVKEQSSVYLICLHNNLVFNLLSIYVRMFVIFLITDHFPVHTFLSIRDGVKPVNIVTAAAAFPLQLSHLQAFH